MKEALLTRIVSNLYTIYMDDMFYEAKAMGKLRLGEKPVVGDRVGVSFLEEHWTIQKVYERKNQLIRPSVANVDQALIVMSSREPDFSYTLVDRLIFLVVVENIEPILVVSKSDLMDDAKIDAIKHEYETSGYQVIIMGEGYPTDALEAVLKGKLSVLAGQSGVGKSSILNRINPDFELNTQEISKALGRGRHTTRHNQLYQVGGGWIADTPGFSSLNFEHVDASILAAQVPDFKPYQGACRYRDCLHIHEPGCKIKEMVELGEVSTIRYEHYIDCIELIKEDSR